MPKARFGIENPAYKHGDSRKARQSKEYRTWAGIKQRTTNPKRPNSKYYLDRGIRMCDRWLGSFESFLEDMGRAPSALHSIERIDVDGNYEPGNCRWATKIEQMSNTRANRFIEFDGERHTQEEWGRITGLTGLIIYKRIKRGWSVEKALTTPHLRSH